MNARRVHAVLAAGVQNPGLIMRWRAEPGLLVRHGILPESIDLTGLWKFAGLTIKVRHNGVRQLLPMTFRLLSVSGMEIEMFAAYATYCATNGRGYAASAEERAGKLAEFLEQWLDVGDLTHALIWDMIRHEQALRLVGDGAQAPFSDQAPDNRLGPASWSATSVPQIRGRLVLHEMRSNPLAVTALLRQAAPSLADVQLGAHYLCYWRAEAEADIQVLQLDEFGFYVLSFVDGERSAGDLCRRLGGTRRPTRGFLRSLTQLASTGLLAPRRPAPSRPA